MKFIFPLLLITLATSAQAIDYDKQYQRCLNKEKYINNGLIYECTERVNEQVKKAINSTYQKLQKKFGDDSYSKEKFDNAQKAWIAYRDAECEFAGHYIGSPMYAICPMEKNIDRLKEMQELLKN